ncbi:MTH1187 family thiamine-binding protein [Chloroflexota bacterium]
MKVIVDFTIIPIGVGVSLSEYVAECGKILSASGLNYLLHPNGTGVEGEWEDVFAAIRRCHVRLHEMGVPRVSTAIKVSTRTDKKQSMMDKITSVEQKLT